jgi:hypothetical protein
MTRTEYNELRSRRATATKYAKQGRKPIESYIPISYSVELKQKLVRMYSEVLSFYICNIRTQHHFPELGECIVMIEYDNLEQYLQLTTTEEQARFYSAVNN